MISVITKGRYGNSMFQCAAAYVYSLKHELEFHAPDKSLAPHLWPVYLQHLSNDNWNSDLETVSVNDGKHTYTPLPFKEEWRDKNIMIGTTDINTGYLQSFRYLEGYEPAIRKAFKLEAVTMPYTCSIHFRGGDYYQYPDKHPVITVEYLREAINAMIAKTGCQWYFVYTDDIPHCIEVMAEVTKLFSGIRFVLNLAGDEEDDFINLMAHANAITANSSFSVLAAILNPNPEKVVICPDESNYFGPGNSHLSVEDLYPPNWIRIKY